jgi:hypothetical protein
LSLEFRMLGSLEIVAEGRTLPLKAAKQKTILALLLLHRDEVVSVDRLQEALWQERPPATATTALQGYVSQLRRLLEEGEKGAGRKEGEAVGRRQRRNGVLVLGGQLQAFAARDQDGQLRAGRDQGPDLAGSVDHMLKVVEQEQQALAADLRRELALGAQHLACRR